jgi:hypothetical protein
MCTVRNPTQITICEVSREKVEQVVSDHLVNAVTFETIHGEGTLVSCLDISRISEFQRCITEALGWTEERWRAATPSSGDDEN